MRSSFPFLRHAILLALLLISEKALTQNAWHYTWTPTCQEAYQKVIHLRFQEAEALIHRIEREDPNNLILLHIKNYLDFFTVFINEDPEEFERLESHKNVRLRQIRQGPEDSPWHLYLQADIRLHWALARLKFEEYATAFFEVNKAFKLLSKNKELYPGFMPNLKDLGILHAAVGTIPEGYRWTVELLSSLEGTIGQGRKEMEQVVAYCENHNFIFEEETYVLYAYLLLHLNKEEEAAWTIINESRLDPANSPMACFILANIALRTKRNDRAIQILEGRPRSADYHPFPYLEFMLGLAKLHRLDPEAEYHFLQFLQDFRGQNFIKEAYQKLAWNALIQGREDQYRLYIQQCLEVGHTVVDSDKAAENEAKEDLPPQISLLKARLLYDGGYLHRSLELLQKLAPARLTSTKDLIEYHYRMGRILQAQQKFMPALSHYEITIEKGKELPWYFACRAALETGHIQEEQGAFKKAEAAFEACLKIKPDEHKTALHQAAKAGLNRLKDK